MADVTTVVVGATTVGANYKKFVINTSDAGREIVISATKTGGFLDRDIEEIYNQLTKAGGDGTGSDTGGPDAFTFAGFGTANGTFRKNESTGVMEVTTNGIAWITAETVYFRIQGTGTPNLTTVDASTYRDNDTNDITLAAVAYFQPAK